MNEPPPPHLRGFHRQLFCGITLSSSNLQIHLDNQIYVMGIYFLVFEPHCTPVQTQQRRDGKWLSGLTQGLKIFNM